jgi:hypothetical protein
MERVTATFDEATLAEIRRLAGRRGLSRFLQIAARERLARLRLLAVLDELDAAHGAPSATVRAGVDDDARRIFRPRPPRPRRAPPPGSRTRRGAR